MASKTGKKANKFGKKIAEHMIEKDDGTRWMVINNETNRPAYLGSGGGVMKQKAEQLSEGLVAPNHLVQVK